MFPTEGDPLRNLALAFLHQSESTAAKYEPDLKEKGQHLVRAVRAHRRGRGDFRLSKLLRSRAARAADAAARAQGGRHSLYRVSNTPRTPGRCSRSASRPEPSPIQSNCGADDAPATQQQRDALRNQIQSKAIDGMLAIDTSSSGEIAASYTSLASGGFVDLSGMRSALNHALANERLIASGSEAGRY